MRVKQSGRAVWVLPLVVFLAGLVLTWFVAAWHERQNQARIDQQLGFEMRDLKELLASDLKSYQQVLLMARNAVSAKVADPSVDLTPLLAVRGKAGYPGAIDFGFARKIQQTALAAYLAQRRHPVPGARLSLPGTGEMHAIVEAQEDEGRGNDIRGVDLMMIDSVAAAARLAVETDKPVMGAPLADMGSDGETGLFMLLPVSAQATAHQSGKASMDGILGWVFARLAIEDMFVEITPSLVEFEVYDLPEQGTPVLIYASEKFSVNTVEGGVIALSANRQPTLGGGAGWFALPQRRPSGSGWVWCLLG